MVDLPVTTAAYTDALQGSQLAEGLSTQDYDPPPEDLEGVIALPNGVLAGFLGRDILLLRALSAPCLAG